MKLTSKTDQTTRNDDVIAKISLAVKNSLLKFQIINSIKLEYYYKINWPFSIKLFYSIKNKLIKLINLHHCKYCKILECKTNYCKKYKWKTIGDLERRTDKTDGMIINDNDDDG